MDIEELAESCEACVLKDDCFPEEYDLLGKAQKTQNEVLIDITGEDDKNIEEVMTPGLKKHLAETKRILMSASFTRDALIHMLRAESRAENDAIKAAANNVCDVIFKKKVFFRGIVEFGNMCEKDCFYCGLRKSNKKCMRFKMDIDEIVEGAKWLHEVGYGSVVLQSGEQSTSSSVDFIIEAIAAIRKATNDELSIVLSCGEYPKEVYQRFFDAGANRYLLRIETSNPSLYASLHPHDGNHVWEERRRCLKDLRDIGFQVGCGVMVGLPGQTIEDLADDIIFFLDMNIDMIGIGPYILHKDTPMGQEWSSNRTEAEMLAENKRNFDLTLRMNALCRLVLGDVNIAATTALQALHKQGREIAIAGGANVLMPNITPRELRKFYLLYEGKPCLDEDKEQCMDCLKRRLKTIGKEVVLFQRFDPPAYYRRRGLQYPYKL